MTIEKCLSICRSKGFPYNFWIRISELEWSCECHCGHAPEEGFEWAWSDKCDDRCAGDSNLICGGSGVCLEYYTWEVYGLLCQWSPKKSPRSQRFFDKRVGGSRVVALFAKERIFENWLQKCGWNLWFILETLFVRAQSNNRYINAEANDYNNDVGDNDYNG